MKILAVMKKIIIVIKSMKDIIIKKTIVIKTTKNHTKEMMIAMKKDMILTVMKDL